MKTLVAVITAIVIWLIYLTHSFHELKIENQKREEACTKISDVVISLQRKLKLINEEKTKVSGLILKNNNNNIEKTLESASKSQAQEYIITRNTISFTNETGENNRNNNIETADHHHIVNKLRSDYHNAELNRRLKYDNNHNTTTNCILLGNESSVQDIQGNRVYFTMKINLMTDKLVHDLSFKFIQEDNKELVIDSEESISLSPNALHSLEYQCFISSKHKNHFNFFPQKNEVCYEFKLYDRKTLCLMGFSVN